MLPVQANQLLRQRAKAIGGGTPIAAVAGRKEIMSMIGPGRIGFGGTYNANPSSLAASKATLQTLFENDGEAFRIMTDIGAKLKAGLMNNRDHEGLAQDPPPLAHSGRRAEIRGYETQSDT